MIETSTTADEVLDTAGRYAPDAAAQARAARSAPWTVAVVGRVGAGKTTLLNRWTEGTEPVGLGGVTLVPTERSAADRTWIDTPGIDGLDRAITQLGPVLARADAVLWVVDGLQPATRTERELLRTICSPGQPLAAVVSRLDLVETDQREGIRERVRTVLDHATAPAGGDLRTWTADPPAPVAPAPTSPRREHARQLAVRAALTALEALPPLEGRAALGRRLADRWRTEVKGVIDRVVHDLNEGALAVDRSVQQRLRREALAAHERFLAQLRDEPALEQALSEGAPTLPLPEPPDPTALQMVVAAMGGEHRAKVRIREQGAHWLSDGLLELAGWLEQAPGIDAAREAREADHDVLIRARTPTTPM